MRIEKVQGNRLFVIRCVDTPRSDKTNQAIVGNGWIGLLFLQYGEILLEVWGTALCPAESSAPRLHDDFVSLEQAAADLGIDTETMISLAVRDGLLLELDGELVVSPHPDIRRVNPEFG